MYLRRKIDKEEQKYQLVATLDYSNIQGGFKCKNRFIATKLHKTAVVTDLQVIAFFSLWCPKSIFQYPHNE